MFSATPYPRTRRGNERLTRSPLRAPDAVQALDRRAPRSLVLPGLALAAAILLFAFLLRYAVDMLPWAVLLVLFALVVRTLMEWLARSELLSAPWLLIIVLAVGAAAWMLWPRSSFQQGLDLTRYLPTSVVRALE